MAFSKLHTEILTSTIWTESHPTRIVWITMLAMANAKGYVSASIPGLAHIARVTREECEHALERFMLPDRDSRTEEFDGRRIEKVDGGWRILNYLKYRETRDPEHRREYMRDYMQEYRKQNVSHVSPSKQHLAEAEAEAEAKKKGRGARTKGARLPSGWEPSETLKAWAVAERSDLNLQQTLESFQDYWASQPGQRGVKLDWDATFRNWVRRESTPKPGSKPAGKMTCTTCKKPITGGYTGSECDPCWKLGMGIPTTTRSKTA